MLRGLGVLFVLLLSLGSAHAQSQVVGNCYNGANSIGTVQWTACPGKLPTTNGASTIGTGGTFQTVLAASTSRNSVTIENNNTSGDNCYVYVGSGTATEGKSMLLTKGGSYQRYYPFVPSDPIQMTCDTTNDTFYLDTQ